MGFDAAGPRDNTRLANVLRQQAELELVKGSTPCTHFQHWLQSQTEVAHLHWVQARSLQGACGTDQQRDSRCFSNAHPHAQDCSLGNKLHTLQAPSTLCIAASEVDHTGSSHPVQHRPAGRMPWGAYLLQAPSHSKSQLPASTQPGNSLGPHDVSSLVCWQPYVCSSMLECHLAAVQHQSTCRVLRLQAAAQLYTD